MVAYSGKELVAFPMSRCRRLFHRRSWTDLIGPIPTQRSRKQDRCRYRKIRRISLIARKSPFPAFAFDDKDRVVAELNKVITTEEADSPSRPHRPTLHRPKPY